MIGKAQTSFAAIAETIAPRARHCDRHLRAADFILARFGPSHSFSEAHNDKTKNKYYLEEHTADTLLAGEIKIAGSLAETVIASVL